MNAEHTHTWSMDLLFWPTTGAHSLVWRCACSAAELVIGSFTTAALKLEQPG
jgi:hypothetical protein